MAYVNAPLRNVLQEQEILLLKTRVSSLETDLTLTQEELGRSRQLLDDHRETSLNSALEIEAVHKKYFEQIAELQDRLLRSEEARLEAESQIGKLKEREVELVLLLHRSRDEAVATESHDHEKYRTAKAELTEVGRVLLHERELRSQGDAARQRTELDLQRMVAGMDKMLSFEGRRRVSAEQLRVKLLNLSQKVEEARRSEQKSRAKCMDVLQALVSWHGDYFSTKVREEEEDAEKVQCDEQYFLA